MDPFFGLVFELKESIELIDRTLWGYRSKLFKTYSKVQIVYLPGEYSDYKGLIGISEFGDICNSYPMTIRQFKKTKKQILYKETLENFTKIEISDKFIILNDTRILPITKKLIKFLKTRHNK